VVALAQADELWIYRFRGGEDRGMVRQLLGWSDRADHGLNAIVRSRFASASSTSGGLNLEKNPGDRSHCAIGSLPQIVGGSRGMLRSRPIECVAQSVERFRGSAANCRIEPAIG
jgi:hypothetical protein